jgi:hypothetical protein
MAKGNTKDIYTISDILDSTPISGNTLVKNFVNRCKENLDAKKDQKETKNFITSLKSISNEIFCFKSNDNENTQICLSRKFSEKKIKPSVDNKTTIAKNNLKNLIKKVSGYSDQELKENDFFNFNEESVGKKTTLKQEFVCFAIHYFFRNPRNTVYDFLYHLQSNKNISIGDPSKLNIQSKTDLNRFKVFAYDMNYAYIADAVGVSKTIIAQKSNLNLKSNLRTYVIGEETSCEHLKNNPFKIIKENETSYYSKPDKLTTADIFLYDTSDKKFYKDAIGSFRRRTLTHEQYRSFINKSFTEGAIIPISLKQLKNEKKVDLNSNFVTTEIKVIGSYDLGEKKSHLEDDFMKSAVELFSTKNKQDFYKKLNSLIDIDVSSAKLATEGTTVEFYAKFSPSSTDGLGGLPYIQSGRGQKYKLWMTVGQIHIMPEKSHSASGLGGISRESLFENVIKKLPKTTTFLNKLIKCRREAFGKYYDTIPELKQKKMLTGGSFTASSNSEFAKVFNQLPPTELYNYLFKYVDKMQKMMKRGFPKMTRQQFMNQKQAYLAHKMSQIEMIFYILSNNNIVKDWIKKSFIMSIYATVSATGTIIFDGKNIDLKKFGRSGIKQTSRLNPMYVKIGY